jgi:hypothetical protein
MQEKTGDIVMATEAWEGNQSSVTGFKFYSVDPTTAVAKLIGSSQRAASGEADPSFYAGFYRSCDPAGSECYRLGFERVTSQSNPGIGITTLGDMATTVWNSKPQPPAEHDYFMSLHRYAGSIATGATEFLSLAPSTKTKQRGLDLIKCTLPDGKWRSNSAANASVIADFGDAHPPRGIGGGDLGYIIYIADYVLQDRYIALVVDYGLRPVQDRWSIAVVDVAESKSAVLPLLPRDFAGTWAVEGLGLSFQ